MTRSSGAESLASPRLWLAFVMMLVGSGLGSTFPVFFPALLAEFGGSRAATASTVSLTWLVAAALGPLAGYLVDRWSPRLLVVTGLGATALGLAGAMSAPTAAAGACGSVRARSGAHDAPGRSSVAGAGIRRGVLA